MRVKVRPGIEQPCNPGVTPVVAFKRVRVLPAPPPAKQVAAKPSTKPIVNCYWSGEAVVLVHPDRTSTRTRARFSVYVRTDQLTPDVLRQLKGSRAVRAILVEAAGWTRIECPDLDYRQKLVLWLEKEKKIPTFEGDLNPVRRYLVDEQPTLAAPRSCYLDIETDSRVPFSRKLDMRILIVSIVDGADWKDPSKPHARRRFILEVDTDEAEEELLKRMWAVLAEYDQVIAWNGDRFDFELLIERSKRRGLNVPFKRWLWLDHLELFRRMNMSAAESGEEKQSMKLGVVAQGLIGETKHDFDASKTWEAWEAGGDERIRLADYCDQDTLLMPKIEEATGYIALLQTLCEVTGTFADTRGISPQQQVDSFMLQLAKKQHYRPHTRIRATAEEQALKPEAGQFEGAYVMQPRTRGIERDVHVCDFAAMYPSIILSWNMSPETKVERPRDPNTGRPYYLARVPFDPFAAALALGDVAVAPGTEAIFRQSQVGILPLAIAELIRLRKYWNDLKATFAPGTPEWKEADRRSTAYKIAGNSFYGVAGSPSSMFFDREVAESVSRSGQWLIKSTIAAAEQRGMRVIYADTDSAFVCGVPREDFEAFVAWCNAELYPRLLKERGCIRNHVKLAYEKQFERVVFTSAKKYCGVYVHYKGKAAAADSKPEIRGLEYKRGDASRLTRGMQGEAIELLMGKRLEDPALFHELCCRWRDRIMTEVFPIEEVKISKTLTKPLRAYVVKMKKDGTPSAQPPHVTVAHLLRKKGQDVGEGAKIDYVCADGSTSPKRFIPADEFDGTFDRHELWESVVYPATQRLLEAAFPKAGWEAYERTRPAKVRGRAQQAKAMLDLFEHAKQRVT